MPPRKNQIVTLSDALKEIGDSLKKVSYAPNMHNYQPHAKQEKFHQSEKKYRLYIGGNRSGKTVGGIMEDIWWATRKHPYIRLPDRPIEGRIVCVDFGYGISQIIIPKLKQWIPPSELRGGTWSSAYDAGLKVLNFENGSTIELMSYEQDVEKFAGVPRDFTHFDEEPPKPIWNECTARLIDRAGRAWVTMTPLEGMTWVYDTLYEPGILGDPRKDVIQIDMAENPYIPSDEREDFLAGLDPDERKARGEGKFVALGGLVYKRFNSQIHVVDSIDPKEFRNKYYRHYHSLDHGFRNPTAALWHAVDPDNMAVTFDEHYASDMIIDEHTRIMKEKEKTHGFQPFMRICDPALAQKQAVTGTSIQTEYAIRDFGFILGNNDVKTGVAKVNQYLEVKADGKPSWYITRDCPNLIREITRLRWKVWASRKQQEQNNPYDEIHKKDDHACDAARYFFSIMPELRQILKPPEGLPKLPDMGNKVQVNPTRGRRDTNLYKPRTQWKTHLNEETY